MTRFGKKKKEKDLKILILKYSKKEMDKIAGGIRVENRGSFY